MIELFGPIHYQWDRDASDKKYIDAIFVVVGTMLYGSTTALLNYLVPFIINGPGILPTRIEELVLDWSRIKVYRKWYKIFEKLAFYDYIKKLIENQSLLGLCLVPRKFEGKCKGNKIQRKSRGKEKVKENKKID